MSNKFRVVGGQNKLVNTLSQGLLIDTQYTQSVFNNDLVSLSTNISPRNIFSSTSNNFIEDNGYLTLSDLGVETVKHVNDLSTYFNKTVINQNKKKLTSYAFFGSLVETLRVSINNIISNWPGSLYFNNIYNSETYYNIENYVYNNQTNTSTFSSKLFLIENNFNININELLSENNDKDFIYNFNSYELLFNDKGYKIEGVTGVSLTNKNNLLIEVKGNPFGNLVDIINRVSIPFHIKLNESKFNIIYDKYSTLEKYLVNLTNVNKFSSIFNIPVYNKLDNSLSYLDRTFIWPSKDGFNPDITGVEYENYWKSLLEVGQLFDNEKSNIIVRKYIPETITDLDYTSIDGNMGKMTKLLNIYGKNFDEIKTFIDSISYIKKLSYDKIDNAPDFLIKNLVEEIGIETSKLVSNENDLLDNVFKTTVTDNNTSTIPYELDIELWRRLAINSNWLLNNKGTRKVIEVLFNFIGAPDCLININQYVYLVDNKIDINSKPLELTSPFGDSLIDNEGYPSFPNYNSNLYFQQDDYFNFYTNLGFKLNKTIDNIKSWSNNNLEHINNSFETNYNLKTDSREVLNSKEISITFDIAKAIECDVYNFNKEFNYPISSPNRNIPYPQNKTNDIVVSGLGFFDYIKVNYERFINVKNRKVITSQNGIKYPTLFKLYEDYLNNSNNDISILSNQRKLADILHYVKKIDVIWDKLVKQFISPTTIINEEGVILRNSIYDQQKFDYKHGINDSSEFQTEQPLTIFNEVDFITLDSNVIETPKTELGVITIDTLSIDKNVKSDIFTFSDINFNNTLPVDLFTYNIPDYHVDNTTKINSATTDNYVYIYSGTNLPLTFNFTGTNNTSIINNQTNYSFNIYPFNNITNIFDSNSVFNYSLNLTEQLDIDNIFNVNIPINKVKNDTEYLLRPSFDFYIPFLTADTITRISPYNDYNNFIENKYLKQYTNNNYTFNKYLYSAYTGINYNTFNSVEALSTNNLTPINYDINNDLYFIVMSKPEKPTLIFNNTIGTVKKQNQILYTENINIGVNNTNRITLSYIPVGDIIVSINGLTLSKDFEVVRDTSIPLPSYQLVNYIINISPSLNILYNPVVTVTYLTDSVENSLLNETYIYSSSTSQPNIVTHGDSFDVILNNNIRPNDDIFITYNGLLLQKNTDYFLSTINLNTINVNFSIDDQAVINVFYLKPINLIQEYKLNKNPYTFNWGLNDNVKSTISGVFQHQFFDKLNINCTGSPITYIETPYVNNLTNYTQDIDFINDTPELTLNNKYVYRLASYKQFKTIINTTATTENYSDIYLLQLPS